MRRPVIALSAAAALVAAAGVSYAVPPVIPSTPVTAPFQSDNVTHLGTVPLEGVGVSMEVRTVGDQVRAFVSGAGGLSIYDATDPTAPELLGHLPLYNWENEDIAVSEDGTTAFLTEFTGTAYLHVVDVSDPLLPVLTGTIPGGSHTVSCADTACGYLYGAEGQIFDVRDRTAPVELDEGWADRLGIDAGSGHNLTRDGAGLWTADANSAAGDLVTFRQVDGDPLQPELITTGSISLGTNYQHNNIRPRADRYVPRAADEVDDPDFRDLRDGELVLSNGESNFTGNCGSDNGAFSTWSARRFDEGVAMTQLDVLRPVSGAYADGDPALNGLGCSGHWFTQTDAQDGSILVAGAWYEHGTRFLKVDPATGGIEQVGFFQPVRGAASEAFLMPDSDTTDGKHVVWTIDYHSGIDILAFDESAAEPTVDEVDASWLAKKGVEDAFATASRESCSVGVQASAAQSDAMRAVTASVGKDTRAFQRLTRIS